MIQSIAAIGSILLWAAILYTPFWTDHVSIEGDGHFHHRAVVQIAEAQAQGIWYPQWLPDQRGGLGDPSFVYYPPLFHTASALLSHATGNAWTAMKLVMLLSTACAGWIVFFYLRTLFPVGTALFGALAVEANPFPMHQMAKGGVYPANVVYPLVLLCFVLLLRNKGLRWFSPGLAIAVCLVALTHVLTCFMLCLTIPPGVAIYYLLRRDAACVQRFFKVCLSMLAGVALSAFYLVPALITMRDISPNEWVLTGICSTDNSFLLPFSIHWTEFCWKSVQLGFPLAALFALILTGWYVWRRKDEDTLRGRIEVLLSIGVVALFLGSELSYPLWQGHSPLRKLQFPDRFNTILLTAALLALILAALQAWRKERAPVMKYLLPATLSLSIFFSVALIADLLRLPPTGTISDQIDIKRDFGTPEYLPAVAKPPYREFLREGSFQGECTRQKISCESLLRSSKRFQFRIESDHRTAVQLPVFAYPAWSVFVDGSRRPTTADPSTGLIRVDLMPGAHTVSLRWRIVPQRWLGIWISVGAALTVLFFSLTSYISGAICRTA